MWKKDETDSAPRSSSTEPRPAASQGTAPRKRGEPATIGPSITIQGEVTGDEDLVIQGRIEGSVKLEKNHVTIGVDGRLKADIFGKSVVVEGSVEGDVKGTDHVVLRQTARVEGNISAPRVTLEDGASFRGGIDMQDRPSPGPRVSSPPTAKKVEPTATQPETESPSKAN